MAYMKDPFEFQGEQYRHHTLFTLFKLLKIIRFTLVNTVCVKMQILMTLVTQSLAESQSRSISIEDDAPKSDKQRQSAGPSADIYEEDPVTSADSDQTEVRL